MGNSGQELQHFGNYDLVRRIDVGGMGEVYLARQRTAFGREVAVKIIRSDLVHDITARRRFLREAEVNAYLKHDHILSLVEFGEEQGRLFLVTPYIKGGTLSKRLQNGPIAVTEVHELYTALVQAVSYLHKRGVIHRDLKPSNILLDQEEDSDRVYVRLIDFGIASLQGMSATAPLTMAGTELGTVAYMAPERADGIAAPSNDIYSLGIILYQMLTGRLPQANDFVPLPQPLEQVIRRATEPNPEDRFSNADELLQSFERAYQSLTGSRPAVIKTPPIASTPVSSTPVPDTNTPVTPKRATPARRQPEQATGTASKNVQEQSRPVPQPQASPIPQQQAEWRLPPLPGNDEAFGREDYNAPTSYFSPDPADRGSAKPLARRLKNVATVQKQPARARTKPRRSMIVLTALLIVVICSAIGGIGFLLFQSAITATITVSPHVQPISNVFTLTARQGLAATNSDPTLIREDVLTSKQMGKSRATTTGSSDCAVLGVFNCKQAVSVADVRALVEQMRPGIRAQIDRDLHKQASTKDAMLVGSITYQDVSATADPPIDTVSQTVSVTLTEQGSVTYILSKDVHDRALTLLKNKLPAHYALMDALTQIGQPSIGASNARGDVTITIAAAGMARYQFTDSEQVSIRNHIKGLSQKSARTFIARQANLEADSVTVHLSFGDTIPNNIQQIKLVIVNPSNLPPVQLTPVATSAPTATT